MGARALVYNICCLRREAVVDHEAGRKGGLPLAAIPDSVQAEVINMFGGAEWKLPSQESRRDIK